MLTIFPKRKAVLEINIYIHNNKTQKILTMSTPTKYPRLTSPGKTSQNITVPDSTLAPTSTETLDFISKGGGSVCILSPGAAESLSNSLSSSSMGSSLSDATNTPQSSSH